MTLPRNILAECGPALYGDRWRSALARELGVDLRTVQRWVAGDSPVPDRVRDRVARLMSERGAELKKIGEKLINAG